MQKAYCIWQDAPWELLDEHQILAIELNRWDHGTLYVAVLLEYGILLYRSLESLQRFRYRLLMDESLEQLEEAFLGQDCLFLTFEPVDDAPFSAAEVGRDFVDLSLSKIQPQFGNLHPLEGLRAFLYDEEATVVLVALEALHRFLRQHHSQLRQGAFPPLRSRYRLRVPEHNGMGEPILIKVETRPELAVELLEMAAVANEMEVVDDDLDTLLQETLLRDDLVPRNSYLSLRLMPWEALTYLRSEAVYYQPGQATPAGDGLPIILIQTSRPKAKAL
ncbi:MAG TPA: hypothetical protein V6D03_13535, partial [Candidatus Caenarcaniphilales bacterium]